MTIEIKFIPELNDKTKSNFIENELAQYLLDDVLDSFLEILARHNVRLDYAEVVGTALELHRKE